MNTKQTVKSCSCKHCTFGKHTKAGNKEIKRDERAYRRAVKLALRKGLEDVPGHRRNYYD